ncbi:MAG TPA: hypothetical protein VEU76_07465 [Candidatus Udaeobacter sp.]|nr:hypothetical protein [Candidatus Udaeobacter sp.]
MRTMAVFFIGLVFAFALGTATGYAARTGGRPNIPAARTAANPCPQGQHPVVWYSARSWACES